ncbi:MAG: fumarylacetoacetate hydrolase family protein [Burkholderiaceae bacterium]|jgi:2-keto-4-pentenoate hydratase/2-oxohepta-3-ene-1,7-dioic acid hydratase in catechol pathway|nr:fumarylacetoacetate hydrolase family protein [Burkholderiaceae bacterium]
METWVRFSLNGQEGFGTIKGDEIQVYTGNMFDKPSSAGKTVKRGDVSLLTPCIPSKMILLWNNFRALAEKLGSPIPTEPLYLLKPGTAFIADGEAVKKPRSYDGKVVYEGELAIVIGKRCKEVSEADAPNYIFGYTCSNDVTAGEIIKKDPTFAQWTRAKGFDTFGSFGPGIVTGITDPSKLVIRTVLNGAERQNYPVSDMVFQPARLVSLISYDMTLEPGDIISCGTSVGVGSMKPGSTVEVLIDGVGHLVNRYEE